MNIGILLNYFKTMDYKFLNKVIDQIVRETVWDDPGYGGDSLDDYRIYGPFVGDDYRWLPYNYMMNPTISDLQSFENHCKGVYGLNKEESDYVWDEWRKIIKDKINNG